MPIYVRNGEKYDKTGTIIVGGDNTSNLEKLWEQYEPFTTFYTSGGTDVSSYSCFMKPEYAITIPENSKIIKVDLAMTSLLSKHSLSAYVGYYWIKNDKFYNGTVYTPYTDAVDIPDGSQKVRLAIKYKFSVYGHDVEVGIPEWLTKVEVSFT